MSARALPESYPAGAFHPSCGTRRVSGELRVGGGLVSFTSEEGEFALPFTELQINVGGAGDRLVFFTHPAHPKVSIFTADQAILEHPDFAQNATLARSRAGIRRRRFVARAVIVGVLLLCVAAGVGAWLAKDPLVRALAARVPAEWERKLGDTAFTQVTLRGKLITDPAVQKQLEQLAAPLLAAVPQDRHKFQLHILEDTSLNAFALPGGKVTVHTGLLLAAETPEEALGVLAHEVAHVTHQHGTRAMVESLGLYAIVTALFGDVSGIAAILVNNAPFLLTQKFSRDHEREADEQGFRYLEAAKLNPRGLVTFFEKVRREEERMKAELPGGEALDALSFLSTHPAPPERIARLEQLLAQSARKDGFATVDLDFKAFQTALRAKLSQPEKPAKKQLAAPKTKDGAEGGK